MEAWIDQVRLSETQRVEIYEEGIVGIINEHGLNQEISLSPLAATLLFDFLLLHRERLNQHAKTDTL